MATDETFWQTKLHARLHDPAEKALVLLRDPEGHEGGTSRALHRDLGFDQLEIKDWLPPDHDSVLGSVLFKDGAVFKKGIPATMYRHVKRADWWAAAADRPQWPMEKISVSRPDGTTIAMAVAPWARVRWSKNPILIHPLTGDRYNLGTLAETEISDIKHRSLEHFRSLIVHDGDEINWRKTLFAFWRFGPELKEEADGGTLGALWPLLPADTRVPDHSIWDHLDLTSAFAGAFCHDKQQEAALLSLSIGPVQPFIAAARTTSDLWAGSHLLSCLSWEAMRVVCEKLGPDAILFPRLRGIPQVDVWLRDKIRLPPDLFHGCNWTERNTDSNPLFAAALPNRFVAVVPESEAESIADKITESVREWLQEKGRKVVTKLLETAGFSANDDSLYCYEQMKKQLAGFPEVYWAAASFSLISAKNEQRDTDLDTSELAQAMKPFFGLSDQDDAQPGFLNEPAWKVVLGKDAKLNDNTKFFAPNPGALYPAVHDLAERVLASAKAVRPFRQSKQEGWRCSLTGETEWLTADKEQLGKPYRKRQDTLWAKVKPAWAKEGEHLGGLSALKRLWPKLFADEVGKITGSGSDARRFVVSTHTMALAGSLEKLHEQLDKDDKARNDLELLCKGDHSPALPPALAKRGLKDTLAAKVPVAMDRLREDEEGEDELRKLEHMLDHQLGHKPEAYYALILFDGDHMGKILSGEQDDCAITYLQSFHEQVREGFNGIARENEAIKRYGCQKRAVSPNRHLAISAALNNFALHVVPEVLEREHRGRVIYAGGDDVFAMLPVADLLSAMPRLRQTYSGVADNDKALDWETAKRRKKNNLICKNGFALMPKRNGRRELLRMMGRGATASCGAVVAHHQTPLSMVMRELRAAEQRAKNEGDRDAFSLTILKRSGGALYFTEKWYAKDNRGEALAAGAQNAGGKEGKHTMHGQRDVMSLLCDLRKFLADKERVSRRAAYNSLAWLKDLPDDPDLEMLRCLLARQFAAQTHNKAAENAHDVSDLTRRLVELAADNSKEAPRKRIKWLENILSVAEFLAREVRSSGSNDGGEEEAKPQTEPTDDSQLAEAAS